jgi:predicted nucleotidyltransferase
VPYRGTQEDTQIEFSDIDIAYKIDYTKFSSKYKDGFSKILRIDAVKKELQDRFGTRVDLVPDSNKSILKELINV